MTNPQARLNTLLASLASSRLLRKGAWGFGDQALISATNFITMVLIARVLSPAEFGLYSLAYTGLLFTNTLQSSLVIQPHTVLGAQRSGDDYIRYTTDTAWFQMGFALFTSLVILAIATIALGMTWWIGPILLALVPANIAWQLQNFVRRAMYTRSDVRGAFINDLASYGGQVVVLLGLWWTAGLTAVTAILALALTSALAFILGMWQIRKHLDWSFRMERIQTAVGMNWEFGKWLLGGNIAHLTSGQIYPILAAGIVSVSATGIMRAAQTIIGPTHVFMSALEPLFVPKAAKIAGRQALPELRSFITRLEVFVLVAMGGYCITVALLAEPILRYVYGPEYSAYSWMLVVVALTTLGKSVRSPVKIGLKAIGETNALFRSYVASSVVNLTLGLATVYLWGFKGVAAGMVINAVVLQIMMWHYHHKFLGDGTSIFSNLTRKRGLTTETAG